MDLEGVETGDRKDCTEIKIPKPVGPQVYISDFFGSAGECTQGLTDARQVLFTTKPHPQPSQVCISVHLYIIVYVSLSTCVSVYLVSLDLCPRLIPCAAFWMSQIQVSWLWCSGAITGHRQGRAGPATALHESASPASKKTSGAAALVTPSAAFCLELQAHLELGASADKAQWALSLVGYLCAGTALRGGGERERLLRALRGS